MQGSEFSCLVFVRVEKQRFGDANFSGGEMILICKFLLLDQEHRENFGEKYDFLFSLSRE